MTLKYKTYLLSYFTHADKFRFYSDEQNGHGYCHAKRVHLILSSRLYRSIETPQTCETTSNLPVKQPQTSISLKVRSVLWILWSIRDILPFWQLFWVVWYVLGCFNGPVESTREYEVNSLSMSYVFTNPGSDRPYYSSVNTFCMVDQSIITVIIIVI